ncbi:MAG: hypothetical protein JNM27_21245 [Leptospirales bacterium]|nr:hypothetical protein [Leptospirales bacterium]
MLRFLILLLPVALFARDDMPELPGPSAYRPEGRRSERAEQVSRPVLAPGRPIPEIPSPSGRIRFEIQEQARNFPAGEYTSLLQEFEDWKRAGAENSATEGHIRKGKELQERLRSLMTRGLYRFAGPCSLKKLPDNDRIVFRIACLPDGTANTIAFARGRKDEIRKQFEIMESGREISGDFRLLETTSQDGPNLLFREVSYSYLNPYLELLHSKSEGLSEEEFLRPEWIVKFLPDLLAVRASERDFQGVGEFLKPGTWLPFQKGCPLRLESVKMLSGEASYRVEVAPSCMRGRASVRVSDAAMLEETALQSDTGTQLFGEMRIGSILQIDGRMYIDWDAIRNSRRAERSTP